MITINSEIIELLDQTRERGWNEDKKERIADWRYYLSLNRQSKVLVIGCGLGSLPIALSEMCGEVYATDSDKNKVSLLEARVEDQNIKNLYPLYLQDEPVIHFKDRLFDLIAINSSNWIDGLPFNLHKTLYQANHLLHEGGLLQISVPNRWNLQTIFNPKKFLSNFISTRHL